MTPSYTDLVLGKCVRDRVPCVCVCVCLACVCGQGAGKLEGELIPLECLPAAAAAGWLVPPFRPTLSPALCVALARGSRHR